MRSEARSGQRVLNARQSTYLYSGRHLQLEKEFNAVWINTTWINTD